MTDISLIVPVYNEEENINIFFEKIKQILLNYSYEIIFCVDPGQDNTEKLIKNICKNNKNVKALFFSRKFGQPSATMAGIKNSIGKTCVIIDVDLQDPPELIVDMYKHYLEGYNAVLAKRRTRKNESIIKIISSKIAYKLINYFSDSNIPVDIGDFRLIDQKIVKELINLDEKNIYLKGLVSYIGYKQKVIEFDRKERLHGNSKYKHYGSFSIFFSGLFGFSAKPLNFLLLGGALISILSFIMLCAVLISKFIFSVDFPVGIPTIIISIFLFAGIQLASIGILGQYVARIFDEVKKRPSYIIKEKINID